MCMCVFYNLDVATVAWEAQPHQRKVVNMHQPSFKLFLTHNVDYKALKQSMILHAADSRWAVHPQTSVAHAH